MAISSRYIIYDKDGDTFDVPNIHGRKIANGCIYLQEEIYTGKTGKIKCKVFHHILPLANISRILVIPEEDADAPN